MHRKLFPSGPTVAKPSGDHIPLGGFVNLNPATFHCDNGVDLFWSPALSSERSQSLKPEATMGTSTKKPLSLQYAELPRLRKAVQEAAAAQSRKATKRNGH
jgi:hypothetical protein